jgi:hypothetical protein
MHHTLGDGERIGGETKLLGRHLDQHATRFGRGHAHLLAAELVAVSPMITVTDLNGTSSSSATIWPMATNKPWPMSILPK